MVDSSGSIEFDRRGDYQLEKDFINRVVNSLQIGQNAVRVGLLIFGTDTENIFYLNSYYDRNQIVQAVNNMRYMATETNIARAFETARDQQFQQARGDRPDVPNVIITITDGKQVATDLNEHNKI